MGSRHVLGVVMHDSLISMSHCHGMSFVAISEVVENCF